MGGVPHPSMHTTKKPCNHGGVSGFLAKMATHPPSKKAKYVPVSEQMDRGLSRNWEEH